MNLQTNSPRTSVGSRAMILALLLVFSASSALKAQQSSSSNSKPQPAPAAPTGLTSHLFIEAGAGGNFGAGLQAGQYVKPGFNGMAGVGYKLARKFAVLAEGNYYHNPVTAAALQTAGENSGSYNTFTVSAGPMYHLYQGPKLGVYAVGGGGFSHIATGFNKPIGTTINCNIYSGLGYRYYTNFCNGKITGSSYASTQPMFDFGLGVDVRLFPNRREIIFVEPKYVKFLTPTGQLPGPDVGIVAVTGGVRW
ncbi:MAG: hypothetical protein ACYDC6_03940 [Acidobacteriaceae bacterium]